MKDLILDKSIFEKINFIIDRIEKNGFEAFLVGGSVRDALLSKTPYDYDIASSAKIDEIKEIFSDFKIIDTGLKYGTVTLILEDTPFEITTFRKNEKYTDFRKPDYLDFSTSILEDLSRRDFTINAMAYNPTSKITDPFNAVEDLQNKIIRCVGDCNIRFNEDSLRIIRALRFASVLDFKIEEKTSEGIKKHKKLLLNISKERITSEFKKLICGKACERIIEEYFDVFYILFPELKATFDFIPNSSHHKDSVLQHSLRVMKNLPKTTSFQISGLFHDVSKPVVRRGHSKKSAEMAYVILTKYKFDNRTKNEVFDLIECHDFLIPEDKISLNKFISELGVPLFEKLLIFRKADILGQKEDFYYRLKNLENINKLYDEIKQTSITSISELAVNGNDLKKIKIPEKKIGNTLHFLLNEVIENKVENEKDKLLRYLLKN
ncbi:MAG: CCA tRNA nucleotidyltransferase [Clostridia bacterium]|nr:CCA tRNA nucleotidyltransferase [Clostridia bacterium]